MQLKHQLLALRFAVETLDLKMPIARIPDAAAGFAPPVKPPQPPSSEEHSTDIRSFTAMKAPKSDRQFAAVVAYFYQFEAKQEDRKETIDGEAMKEAARLAGRAQVARWNMTLTNAKNAGYLDSVGNGKFKLSSVGENLVAITLPGDQPTSMPSKTGVARKVAKKSAKKKTNKK